MAFVIHDHTIRTPFPLSHIQIACDGVYIALPFVRTLIGVWSVHNLNAKPLEFEGHKNKVSALCFSNTPTLLCSAGQDYVIIWDINKARICWDKGEKIRGHVVAQNLGPVQYCSFSPDDRYVAVCADIDIFILDIKGVQVEATLEGHDGIVTCAEFCPHYTSTLVSAGEDRTFKIWNLHDKSLIYQSTIISSSPFISLAMCPQNEQFALGTADGQVRVYDLSDDNGFRSLHHLDVSKILGKKKREKIKKASTNDQEPVTISSKPSWQRQQPINQSDASQYSDNDESEAGSAILGLYYSHSLTHTRTGDSETLPFLKKQENSLVSELLNESQMLVIGTTNCVLHVNSKTLEMCSFVDFQDPVPSRGEIGNVSHFLSIAGSFSFAQNPYKMDEIFCIVGSLLQNVATILRVNISIKSSTAGDVGDSVETDDNVLSVLSSAPLCANSALKAELVPKGKDSDKKSSKGNAGSKNKKSPSLVDQPLTFKTKIKSSGYTETPRKTMFQPKTNVGKSGSPKLSKSGASKVFSQKEYPMKCPPPTELQSKLDVGEKPTPINSISFSGDGQHLACALSNKSAQIFKMPLTGKGAACTGHNGIVGNIHWSYDNQWLLTASDDKTACIWSCNQGEPIMVFDTTQNNLNIDKEGQSAGKIDKTNPAFPKEIKHAQFYYMDKFILLASGNTFYLYKYHLDPTKSDIKRYLTNSRYKIVKSLQMDKAQQITALSAINSFYSYLVLCAGSNKSVEVFDMNTGQSVRIMQDIHTRPVHAVCQNEGSAYVSHPESAYDLFLTAAAADCIKLWDLRTNRCIHRYEGHMNRAQSCGLAFSPCSRFIATGSEDRSAYIFDTRSGTYFHKLTGHTDVVSDVAFHPLYPELVTATLDGKLRLFCSP